MQLLGTKEKVSALMHALGTRRFIFFSRLGIQKLYMKRLWWIGQPILVKSNDIPENNR